MRDRPHACDESCICPVHGTPLLYWPFGADHACSSPDCRFARGMNDILFQEALEARLQSRRREGRFADLIDSDAAAALSERLKE